MITIVVGAQYGGEGKGKISAFLAHRSNYAVACRCGGPNSSHTVIANERTYRLRMMPTAAVVRPKIAVVFGAGTLIHVATLLKEIEEIGFEGDLLIDQRAGIVTDEIVAEQRGDNRYESIGSTLTGTGYATAKRSLRSLTLAGDCRELRDFVGMDTSQYLKQTLDKKRWVLVEGHQGYGLSNYHGDYPFVSSRDSTSAAMLSELGLGPKQKKMEIVLVAKLFPTRNHPGSLGEELSLQDADALGISEYGGGSWGINDRRRRVGIFDLALVHRAIIANSPTTVALTGADYLDHQMKDVSGSGDSHLTPNIREIVQSITKHTETPVGFVSTGPKTASVVELPSTNPSKLRRAQEPSLDLQ